ncbi:MAG: LysE family translocator [Pseudomonadota bacterium]
MTYELITALSIFAFVSLITPGPNNLMLMASGMNYGVVRTIPHMLGIGIGFPVMVLLVGAGLMGVFEAVPHSYTVLQTVSAVYLLYLAWKIATAAPVSSGEETAASRPLTFLQAAMFQWVNPKAWAMALTAISIYTPPSKPVWSVLLIALMFALMGGPTISLWAFVGQQLRRFLGNPLRLRIFNISCALLLAGSLYPMLMRGSSGF